MAKKTSSKKEAISKKPSVSKKATTKKATTQKATTQKATTKKATTKKSTSTKKVAATKQVLAVKSSTAKVSADLSGAVEAVLAELKSLGNDKVRAMNAKNGAGEHQFGVKLGDIRNVANKLKANHELAMSLWKTGIVEAQLVATLLIKAKDLAMEEMDRMVRSVTYVQVGDWLHSNVLKEHADKEKLRQQWMQTKDPMAARAGWRLTAGRVVKSPDGLDLDGLLNRIESEMPSAPAVVQWTMNTCLAEIGINHPKLRKRAIAIGEKLGIYRDYPCSKGCTSPFAPTWIAEMVRRQG